MILSIIWVCSWHILQCVYYDYALQYTCSLNAIYEWVFISSLHTMVTKPKPCSFLSSLCCSSTSWPLQLDLWHYHFCFTPFCMFYSLLGLIQGTGCTCCTYWTYQSHSPLFSPPYLPQGFQLIITWDKDLKLVFHNAKDHFSRHRLGPYGRWGR